MPWASQLVPGQGLPSGVDVLVRAVAGNAVVRSASQLLLVVGVTSASWGLGVGVYLFVVVAVLRIAGAL